MWGTLKLDQAQFRELEAFSKFGSDLDAATMATLNKGTKNVEILKQGQYQPLTVENQVVIIFCGTRGLLSDVPTDKVREFEKEYLDFLNLKHKDVLKKLKEGKIDEDVEKILTGAASEIAERYK